MKSEKNKKTEEENKKIKVKIHGKRQNKIHQILMQITIKSIKNQNIIKTIIIIIIQIIIIPHVIITQIKNITKKAINPIIVKKIIISKEKLNLIQKMN